MLRTKNRRSEALPQPERSKHVLIVDDQSPDLIGPYNLSVNSGFEVSLAFDGGQAFELITQSKVDLLILDWNMPYVNGEELLKALMAYRFRKPQMKLPKVVLFSGADLRGKIEFLSMGIEIVDVWRKPMVVTEMAQRLNAITESL